MAAHRRLFGLYFSDFTDLSSQKLVANWSDEQVALTAMKECASREINLHPGWGATRENENLSPNVLEVLHPDGRPLLRYEVCPVAKDEKGHIRKVLIEVPGLYAKIKPTEGRKGKSPMGDDEVAQLQEIYGAEASVHSIEVSENNDKQEQLSSTISDHSHSYYTKRLFEPTGPAPPSDPSDPLSAVPKATATAEDRVHWGLYIWTKIDSPRGMELRTIHTERGKAEADRTALTLSYIDDLKMRNQAAERAQLIGNTIEFRDVEGNVTAEIMIREGSIIFGSAPSERKFITRNEDESQTNKEQRYDNLHTEWERAEPTPAPTGPIAVASAREHKPTAAIEQAEAPAQAHVPGSISAPRTQHSFPALATGLHLPEGLYCLCQGSDDGRPMVACDNDDCQYNGWFHLSCLGLAVAPAEELWFCTHCSSPNPGLITKCKGAAKKATLAKKPAVKKIQSGRVAKPKTKTKVKAGGRKR